MSASASLRDIASRASGHHQAAELQKPRILQLLEDPRVVKGMSAVAGKFLQPDRMLRLCINAVRRTPELLACDPQSVLGAMMASAALGLEPNTVQQQAYLLPYKRRAKVGGQWVDVMECQFQIGYRGFLTLMYRSPHIKSVVAEAIHAHDVFEHLMGSQSFLKFSKKMDGDRGPLIGSFCLVKLASGEEVACVLPLSEIEKIRGRSETFRALARNLENATTEKDRDTAARKFADTPWVLWEDDMAAKSAIKKIAKLLPIAAAEQLAAAAEIDSGADTGAIDLGAMSEPTTARAVFDEGAPPPALEHDEWDPGAVIGNPPIGQQQRQHATTARQPEPEPEPEPERAPDPDPAHEAPAVEQQQRKPPFDLNAGLVKLASASDLETLNLLADELRAHAQTAQQQRQIGQAYRARQAELEGAAK